MKQIDRRTFVLGIPVALALPLLGCGGGGSTPPVSAQAGPTAVSRLGVQFAALRDAHSLVVTSAAGTSKRVGGVGFDAGQLNYPSDVAVLGELAYVVETGNHRVQVFDSGGAPKGTIGEGVLNYPGGIITTDDEILISDSRNARVVGFDTRGRVTRTVGAGSLSAPRGLAITRDAMLVADPGLRKVLKLGLDGSVRGEFGNGWVLPYDVATDGVLVYVADASANEVAVVSSEGERIDRIALDAAPNYLSFRSDTLYVA